MHTGTKIAGTGVAVVALLAGAGHCEAGPQSASHVTGSRSNIPGRPAWLIDNQPDHRCLADWPVRKLVGQLVTAGIPGDDLAAYAPVFAAEGIGGAVIMSEPDNPNDGSIKKFKNSEDVPILISTDEEGGTVQRFKKLGLLPSEESAARSSSSVKIERIIGGHAKKQAAIGIDQDLGPVADRAQGSMDNATDDPLGSRVFSSNEATVKRYSLVYAHALMGADIIPTFKHFPGALSANSDVTMSHSPSLAQLRKRDFAAYYALEKLGKSGAEVAIMVGTTIPEGSGRLPADLSRPIITGELRGAEGFNKQNELVVTDDLGTKPIAALGISVPQAVEMAIEAGVDQAMVVVEPRTPGAVRAQVAQIIGRLVAAVDHKRLSIMQLDDSVLRVLTAKGYKCAD